MKAKGRLSGLQDGTRPLWSGGDNGKWGFGDGKGRLQSENDDGKGRLRSGSNENGLLSRAIWVTPGRVLFLSDTPIAYSLSPSSILMNREKEGQYR